MPFGSSDIVTLCRCLGLDILIRVLLNMVWLHSIINAGVTVLAVVVVLDLEHTRASTESLGARFVGLWFTLMRITMILLMS